MDSKLRSSNFSLFHRVPESGKHTPCLGKTRRAPFSCPHTAAQHHFHSLSTSGASLCFSHRSQRCCDTAVSGVKCTASQDTAGKWSSVLQTGSPLQTAIHFPSPQLTFPGAPSARRGLGLLTPLQTLSWQGLKGWCLKLFQPHRAQEQEQEQHRQVERGGTAPWSFCQGRQGERQKHLRKSSP